jgi:hypothetical protein
MIDISARDDSRLFSTIITKRFNYAFEPILASARDGDLDYTSHIKTQLDQNGCSLSYIPSAGEVILDNIQGEPFRALLVASLIGSNVVFLAWFAPVLPSGLHAYGFPQTARALLFAVLVINFLLTLLGLAPAGCLRSRKA